MIHEFITQKIILREYWWKSAYKIKAWINSVETLFTVVFFIYAVVSAKIFSEDYQCGVIKITFEIIVVNSVYFT